MGESQPKQKRQRKMQAKHKSDTFTLEVPIVIWAADVALISLHMESSS